MLFRASSIVLLVLSLNFLWGVRPVNYTLAALLLIWTAVSIRGMTSMRSQVFGRVYWRGENTPTPAPPPLRLSSGQAPVGRGTKYSVALTFDDGPCAPSTGRVLDVLREHGVKATFFVIGENVRRYPELAARVRDEGHEFGNHTYSHPWMFRMSFSGIKEDIELCQKEIEGLTGHRPRFFRQPIGVNNPSVMKVVDGMGMVMVGWQARAYDGMKVDKADIVRRILSRVKPGGIILLHDGSDGRAGGDRCATADALTEIIPALKARGYEFVTVGELLGMENRQG
jgi:peptidoglycan/xylan/chitin deacetylase (PgdA/CDA1 family)